MVLHMRQVGDSAGPVGALHKLNVCPISIIPQSNLQYGSRFSKVQEFFSRQIERNDYILGTFKKRLRGQLFCWGSGLRCSKQRGLMFVLSTFVFLLD